MKALKLLLILLALQASAQHQSDHLLFKEKEYTFPPANHIISSFSILSEELILLPLGGGVFLPGQNLWYFKPEAGQVIQTMSPCFADTSLYVVADIASQVQIVQLTKKKESGDSIKKLKLLPKGMYAVYPLAREQFYLWGINRSGYGVWQWNQQKARLDTILSTRKPITAFTPIDKNTFLTAYDGSVWLFRKGEQPNLLCSLDTLIDGLCVAEDGSFFVSCPKGILRLPEKKKTQLITNEVHGLLVYRNNSIYVLDRPRNRILQLKW